MNSIPPSARNRSASDASPILRPNGIAIPLPRQPLGEVFVSSHEEIEAHGLVDQHLVTVSLTRPTRHPSIDVAALVRSQDI